MTRYLNCIVDFPLILERVLKSIVDYVNYVDNEESKCNNGHAKDYPFRTQEIWIRGNMHPIKPFDNWDSSKPAQSLAWWDAYDNLKHNRFNSRKLANQENAINILAALFFLEMKLLKKCVEGTNEIDVYGESSQLFLLKRWSIKAIPMNESFKVLSNMFEFGDKYEPELFDV